MNRVLRRYEKILKGGEKTRFLTNKQLKDKVKKAYSLLKKCELCERKCLVNRNKEMGECKVGNSPVISSAFPHFGEEPFFVPSFTIFFMGCNLHCQYCQNFTISQWCETGKEITTDELADLIKGAKECKNVNFVGGDPTPHIPFILDALEKVSREDFNIPIIWNSNFYMSTKAMDLLKGTIDVYLSDFKYGNDGCASRLSKVNNYFGVVSRNHRSAFYDSELVIRHLLLPNHFECCTKPILNFIAENFGDKVIVNIMDQYRPTSLANKYPEINCCLTDEHEKAVTYANRLGLNFIH